MPKFYIRALIFCILLFHAAISIHGLYSMFPNPEGWTLYSLRPFFQLFFTFVWAGIFFQKRWCFFLYLSLLFYELAMNLFFGKYLFGQVFGDVFFPADLVFAFLILLLYKQHFGERTTQTQ